MGTALEAHLVFTNFTSKVQWLLYVPADLTYINFTFSTQNVSKFTVTMKSNYLRKQHELIGLRNGDSVCTVGTAFLYIRPIKTLGLKQRD